MLLLLMPGPGSTTEDGNWRQKGGSGMAVDRLGDDERIYYNYVLWCWESEGIITCLYYSQKRLVKFDLIIHDLFLGGKDDCF